MSVQAITWALDFRVRSATEKAILLVLANYANEFGISWPSQPTVAEQAACNDRTVRRTLLEFETRGILKRFPRWRRNGSRQSDVILLVAFEGREPAPPGSRRWMTSKPGRPKTYPQGRQIGRLCPGLSGPHTRSFRVRYRP